MKKIGFRKRLNIDWSDPFMVFFIVFTAMGVLVAIFLTIFSVWKEGWLISAIFGGVGIFLGIVGFVSHLIDG